MELGYNYISWVLKLGHLRSQSVKILDRTRRAWVAPASFVGRLSRTVVYMIIVTVAVAFGDKIGFAEVGAACS